MNKTELQAELKKALDKLDELSARVNLERDLDAESNALLISQDELNRSWRDLKVDTLQKELEYCKNSKNDILELCGKLFRNVDFRSDVFSNKSLPDGARESTNENKTKTIY